MVIKDINWLWTVSLANILAGERRSVSPLRGRLAYFKGGERGEKEQYHIYPTPRKLLNMSINVEYKRQYTEYVKSDQDLLDTGPGNSDFLQDPPMFCHTPGPTQCRFLSDIARACACTHTQTHSVSNGE